MVPASAGVILQGRELAEVMKNGTRKRGGDPSQVSVLIFQVLWYPQARG